MSIIVRPKKKKITLNDIYSYLQGWYRYSLYYSSGPRKFLMRKHIRRQIDARIDSMNRECYNSGSCIKCGCATTALQMANKSCEGFCYPPMMNYSNWKYAKEGAKIIRDDSSGKYWSISYLPELENGKFKRMVLKFLKL